jgi:tetratricopeptide (TPR) repeat protein
MAAKKTRAWFIAFLLSVVASAGGVWAAPPTAETKPSERPLAVLVEGSGVYGRPGTARAEITQSFFDQGLRLLWGYYAVEAAASFQEALRHEPDNAMLYWGLALAISPNPNSRYQGVPDDPKREGRKAIQRALSLSVGTNSKERDFIEALAVRYDTTRYPDRETRDGAYVVAARGLATKYPADPDAVALYADSVMTQTPWLYWDADGAPIPPVDDVIAKLDAVLEKSPDHPGANHLYIHILESSPNPERALPHADRLEGLMPKAGHVVHMPSHIYVRVGMYDAAIASNERSLAADRYFVEAWGDHPLPTITTYKLSARMHPGHASDFIRFAATSQGNYQRAITSARAVAQVISEERLATNGRAQLAVANVWMVNKIFGKWGEVLAEQRRGEGVPYLDGIWHYTQGSALAAGGNIVGATRELSRLRQARERVENSKVRGFVNPPTTLLDLATDGLVGEIAEARGANAEAVEAYSDAVALQDDLRFIEPPDWPQPMRLYLGAALLRAGDPQAAEQIYRQDLAWNQNSGWALYGLGQSLREQGETEAAAQVEADFQKSWKSADVSLTASKF